MNAPSFSPPTFCAKPNQAWKFAEAIVIFTTRFPLNENDSNDNLFPQHFFFKHNSFWTIPRRERGHLCTKSNIFFRNITIRLWSSAQSAISFCSSPFLLQQADCHNNAAQISHSSTQMLQFYSHFSANQSFDINAHSNTAA